MNGNYWRKPADMSRYLGFLPPYGTSLDGPATELYFARSGEFLKIGIAEDVARRLKTPRAFNPHGVELEASRVVPRPFARPVERRMHKHFADRLVTSEWFRDLTLDEALPVFLRIRAQAQTALDRYLRDGFFLSEPPLMSAAAF